MYVPVTWLRELADVPATATAADIAADLVRVGLEEEGFSGGDITGPIVVGRVLDLVKEEQKNGKTINYCHVDVGENGQKLIDGSSQEIVCGAHNFVVGDLVVVVLPGAVLPGGFAIAERKTYGHMSRGMICSQAELGLGEDHDGIIVLTEYFAGNEEVLASLTPGQDAMPLLGLGEQVLEVNVTPDRGYCFSLRGLAREYAVSTGREFRDPVPHDVPAPQGEGIAVRIDDPAGLRGVVGCTRYVGLGVSGVNPSAPTPPWMAKRLVQMGMRPISLMVDVTNYVMLLTGQPLHAFDRGAVQGPIVVRRATAGETFTTLDDVERTLDAADLLITDGGSRVLALAGVMGGATSEVTANTTDILLESAHFDPVTVALSARRHGLVTESGKRFERGVDPTIQEAAAYLAAQLIVEHGGGTIEAAYTVVGERPQPSLIQTSSDRVAGIIQPGPDAEGLSHDDVVRYLQAVGCDVRTTQGSQMEVTVPAWRPDLRLTPDLAEEVARVRGYDQIPFLVPAARQGRGLTSGQRFTRSIARAAASLGLTEVLTFPFSSQERFDQLRYDADDTRRLAVAQTNPLLGDQPLFRTSVLDSLLDAARLNASRGAKDVAIYEIGQVAHPASEPSPAPRPAAARRPNDDELAELDAALPAQPQHFGAVWCGELAAAGPWGDAVPASAEASIAIMMELLAAVGIHARPVSTDRAPWHPGRCASLVVGADSVVGQVGELHPKVVQTLGLPPRSCAAELDLTLLATLLPEPVRVGRLSTFPVAHSDVALVVDDSITAAQVAEALREGCGEQLEELSLFDVYRGEQVGEGKKSLAFRMTFRDPRRTLTTEEANTIRDRAVTSVTKVMDATQRGV